MQSDFILQTNVAFNGSFCYYKGNKWLGSLHMPENADRSITVSVRNVVTFILRAGDISSDYVSPQRLRDGTRLHQKLQKRRKSEAKRDGTAYDSEVRLSHSFTLNGFDFTVEGRADGVLTRGDSLEVEEIKSVSSDPAHAAARAEDDPAHWHWAQAKCYAYFLCMERALPDIGIRLTYIHTETEECDEVSHEFLATELKAFFDELMLAYFQWAEWEYSHRRARNISILAGGFPYAAFRTGQRDFAAAVYRTVRAGKNLFAEAPTGTGKTISTLFPAVKAMGEGHLNRVFYLTAKTITRTAAESAVSLLRGAGYDLLSLTLTAKDKICPLPVRACNPRDCERARGHFDRVNAAVWEVIAGERAVSRETIEAYAEKHCVCPHETALDVSLWSDIVIGDYNYAFDPNASLKRFFGGNAEPDAFVFLIDEAHNLIERAREMFSAALYKEEIQRLRRALKLAAPPLYRTLGKISKALTEAIRQIPEGQTAAASPSPPDELCRLLNDFIDHADKWMAERGGADDIPDFLDIYFNIFNFLNTREAFDERYAVYLESGGNPFLRLMCLDPSLRLSDVLQKAVSAVFFSATLTPLPYFRQSLGGREDDGLCRLPSPFPRGNLFVAVDGRVSTRYKDRENSCDAVAARLASFCRAKKGNYFAFFPSYSYLQNVLARFTALCPDVEPLIQRQGMTEPEREAFLDAFRTPRGGSLLAFAVMGGMFSEGIDLVGDSLIGAAIVGVGLPLVSEERDVVAAYYERAHGEGFNYAYMYPGMNKVMQAAGRVIRTETDRGAVLLIDDRFLTMRYRELFPAAWQSFRSLRREDDLEALLSGFWASDL